MNKIKSILPPLLKPGDTIGLFSPAGPVRDHDHFEAGRKILHEMGFKTRTKNASTHTHDYLSAPDNQRIQEFHSLWADNEVRGLLAIRGGYGCLRIVNKLDFQLISSNPKPLIGFSDITVLLNTIWQQTGIITFHGPVLTTLAKNDKNTLYVFYKYLTGQINEFKPGDKLNLLKEGNTEGTLLGGNLTTIIHLLGTPWEIPWSNTILILEDTGEPLYKLDRMFNQLLHSGKLAQLKGLILGNFDAGNDDTQATLKLQEQLWQLILDLTVGMDFPIWSGVGIGHLECNHMLPIGMHSTMDSESKTLYFHPEPTTGI